MKPQLATFEEVKPLLSRIDQSNIYSNRGPLVLELEDSYANYLGVEKDLVVAISNATLAIQGLISISSNSDWIVPDYTFAATGLAVLNANRRLHICDVKVSDWKLNLELLTKVHRSFGIIPVMPFGSEVDFGPYQDYDEVIVDAAASLGSMPPRFCEMKEGWAVVYSLHATKVLGAGEGAIVVCGNQSQASSLRAWSNFGFSTDRIARFQGTNAKMSEVTAAYALFSIQNLAEERESWIKSQSYVATRVSGYSWKTFVNSKPQFHPYWIASFTNNTERNLVAETLNGAGIQSRDWWPKSLSSQTALAKSQLIGPNGIAKSLSEKHLGLPMFRGLASNSVEEICDLIEAVLKI